MFSNRYKLWSVIIFSLASLQICALSAKADCRPGKFHLEAIVQMPIRQLAELLHDKTGCNFIFDPSLLDNKLSITEGNYQPVSLIYQLAKRLKSEVSVARTVLAVSPTKLILQGTGKLVSVDLHEAKIASVNQLIKKLGSDRVIAGDTDSKLTISLYDVPLDDLASILEFQLNPPSSPEGVPVASQDP